MAGRRRWDARRGVFLGGQMVSLFGDGLAVLAVPLLVLQLTRSPVAAALAAAPRTVGYLLVGLVAGPLVDRADPWRLMIAMDAVRAAAFVAMYAVAALDGPVWPVLALAFAAGGAGVFFESALMVAVKTVFAPAALVGANASLELATQVARALGPATVALLSVTIGIRPALLLNAATFMVSVLTLTTRPTRPPRRTPACGVPACEQPTPAGHPADVPPNPPDPRPPTPPERGLGRSPAARSPRPPAVPSVPSGAAPGDVPGPYTTHLPSPPEGGPPGSSRSLAVPSGDVPGDVPGSYAARPASLSEGEPPGSSCSPAVPSGDVPGRVRGVVRGLVGELRDGVRFILATRVLLVITGAQVVINFALGSEKLVVFFLRDTLALSPDAVGLVVAAGGAGGIAGALAAPRLARRAGDLPVIVAGIAVTGAAFAVLSLTGTVSALAGAYGLMLCAQTSASVVNRAMRLRLVPRALTARVFGTARLAFGGADPAGAMLAGALTTALSGDPRPIFATAGALVAATSIAIPTLTRHPRTPA